MMLGKASQPAPIDLSDENFLFLQKKIHQHSGIVIERPKQYLLEARLMPLMQRRSLRSLNELSSVMRARADLLLLNEVIESMTTHETYFFRDQAQFDALRTKLIPELMSKRQSRRKLSFWSAAASSGQEAYTLTMILQELHAPNWKFEILATDLSERILSRARAGIYTSHDTSRGLQPELRTKYFQAVNSDFQLREPLRRMVEFRKFDLRQEMRPLGTFDVIFCRNVLIYFDLETRRKILEQLASVLAPDGILLLGSTESTLGITEKFERHTIAGPVSGAIFYRPAVKS